MRILSKYGTNMVYYPRHLLFLRWCNCPHKKQRDVSSFVRTSFSSVGGESEVPYSITVGSPSTLKIHDLLHQGCLPYPKTWAYQVYLLHHRLEQRRRQLDQTQQKPPLCSPVCGQDCLLVLEHSSVYTLGRGADETHLTFLQHVTTESEASALQNLSRKSRGPGTARLTLDRHMEEQVKNMMKQNIEDSNDDANERSMLRIIEKLTESISPVVAPNGVPVYRVERGGEVTYHGPKQLVVYPMIDLKNGHSFKMDLHWYLRMIEEVLIQTLAHYNIEGKTDEINTGVWVGKNKIAAIGISSSRWITTHGFALNVDPDLSYFDTSIILPCGIEGRGVTSLGEILRAQDRLTPSIAEVAGVVISIMGEIFDVKVQ
mmetsp:Transcript_64038/g.73662  ORF Transcript_64038/g.73662 Transcript_64038/m.73662 type:complete len:372 (+) Transcript_64038:40-1155(+)